MWLGHRRSCHLGAARTRRDATEHALIGKSRSILPGGDLFVVLSAKSHSSSAFIFHRWLVLMGGGLGIVERLLSAAEI